MLRRAHAMVDTQKRLLQQLLIAVCVTLLPPALAIAQQQAVPRDTLSGQLLVVIASIVVVVTCVVLHYEALSYLSGLLKRLISVRPRHRILLLIFSILFIHVIEIWIFGGTYFLLIQHEGSGALVASHAVEFLDSIYFSAVCFTTLGLGDVVPMGAVRFLAGSEALTGFVLVTWSASFAFVEMQRFWKE
jgi:1-acyl-sn-glycerol-3-phosphate acyltransferase